MQNYSDVLRSVQPTFISRIEHPVPHEPQTLDWIPLQIDQSMIDAVDLRRIDNYELLHLNPNLYWIYIDPCLSVLQRPLHRPCESEEFLAPAILALLFLSELSQNGTEEFTGVVSVQEHIRGVPLGVRFNNGRPVLDLITNFAKCKPIWHMVAK